MHQPSINTNMTLTDPTPPIASERPYPQLAIDNLPEGYEIVGWCDTVKIPFDGLCFDDGIDEDWEYLEDWHEDSSWCLYAKKIALMSESYEEVCAEALRIQGGDRQQDYGSPKQNFQEIADMWNTYIDLKEKPNGVTTISATDVANMMILMKIVRNNHKPKRDNWVDIAGYAQCGAKVEGL